MLIFNLDVPVGAMKVRFCDLPLQNADGQSRVVLRLLSMQML